MDLQKSNIETLTAEILILSGQTAINMIEIGKRLIQAKDQLPYGEWGKWLKERVQFTDRTARNFMRAAQTFGNRKTFSDLPPSKVIALLDVPAESREKFTEQNNLNEMSVREIKEAGRKLKEAEAACQAAETAKVNAERQAREAESRAKRAESELTKLSERKPVVQIKEVEKVVEKPIADPKLVSKVEQLQQENERLKDRAVKAESKVIVQETDEKNRLATARAEKRVLNVELDYLTGKISHFLMDVAKYGYISDVITNAEKRKVDEYHKAMESLSQWLYQMKRNMPCGGEVIDIEGVASNG